LLAIATDAVATFASRYEDQSRFNHREVVMGTVERVAAGTSQYRLKYELFGTFTTADGKSYPFRFRANGGIFRHELRMDAGTPPEVGKGIEAGVPFKIPVAYDPKWPARNWLGGDTWDETNRYWYVGFMFLLVQLLGVLFTLIVLKDGYDHGALRSWWQCFAIVPLMFQALIVFGLGMDYIQQGVMNLS